MLYLQSESAFKEDSDIRKILESGAFSFHTFAFDKAAWVLFGAIVLGGKTLHL